MTVTQTVKGPGNPQGRACDVHVKQEGLAIVPIVVSDEMKLRWVKYAILSYNMEVFEEMILRHNAFWHVFRIGVGK